MVENPENRVQDYHEKLLCEDCEQQLNKYESPFAGYIFHPYIKKNSDRFQYSDWLQKFVISVQWRLMISDLSGYDSMSSYQKGVIKEASQRWYDVLIENDLAHDPYSHHMIFLNDLNLRTDVDELPDNWEQYRDRATDGTVIVGNGGSIHHYFKFPEMAFISCILPPTISGFKGTEILPEGRMNCSQSIPEMWEMFLLNRVNTVFQLSYSEDRLEQITDSMLKNPDRTINSQSFSTWIESMNRKVENHDPSDYLDGECPVCFTDHRIIESLPNRPINEKEAKIIGEKSIDNCVFFECIFTGGELEHPVLPDGLATTIIYATENKVMKLAVYEDHGWIVETERKVPEAADAVEAAEFIWEDVYNYHLQYVEEG